MNRSAELKEWAAALRPDRDEFFAANPVRATTGTKTNLYKDVRELFQPNLGEEGYISAEDYNTRVLVLAFAYTLDKAGDL
jgi:hypothetical protein